MKKCSLNSFMAEMQPWLDKDHIRRAEIGPQGHFILHFMDGMKNVYDIDDCNREQVNQVLHDLKAKGIATS